ncbi:MAG: electron transport complex subunit RsxC [Clostridiales bacterium]|nr:electron transport complex subunit RsxC [Clostridiales bacterium]MCD7827343.1 electron transport complex subunit RsxC [Clostridiales bacterium]
MSNNSGGILHAVKRVRGGVFVDHNKLTKDLPVVRITPPDKVVLPMLQHIGAPCTPTVKVGDTVSVGQVVGDSDKLVSAPIHASVSGKVVSVGDVKVASGKMLPAVTIESDGEMRLFEGIEPPKADTREDFIKAVRASGLVGLGGAGFPTHVKLAFDPSKNIDTLVVNAAECEPYITVDYRECIDNSWDVIGGVYTLAEVFGFKNVVIAVEDNKPDAIKILKNIADKDNSRGDIVKLMTLKSKYPQGAEKMMVQSATGRRVPPGKLPADVGCVVMNIASVAFISRYLKTGKPLVSRSMTVSGSAVKEPKNVRVPIGIEAQDVIDFCGGFKKDPVKIIAGGPMMGTALIDTHVPVLKSNNALLAFADGKVTNKRQSACIHCGRCAEACPMSLLPTEIEKLALNKDAEGLVKAGVNVCMECGSCAYSCPAAKPLVQYMRLGKEIVREAGAKK